MRLHVQNNGNMKERGHTATFFFMSLPPLSLFSIRSLQ